MNLQSNTQMMPARGIERGREMRKILTTFMGASYAMMAHGIEMPENEANSEISAEISAEISSAHQQESLEQPSDHIQQLMATPEGAESLVMFKNICHHLIPVQLNANVHVLDAYVFGADGKLPSLLKVGRFCGVDKGDLSWDEIKEELSMLFPGELNDVITTYEGVDIKKEQLNGYIDKHFSNFPIELNHFFSAGHARCEEMRELWSRTITLTQILATDERTPIDLLAQAIAENYLTQGGCIQGRINRTFVRYASLLGLAGLGDL